MMAETTSTEKPSDAVFSDYATVGAEVVRIREYSREEWERIAKLADPERDLWFTWEAFQDAISREQALELYKAEARRVRAGDEQRTPPGDPPRSCA
jgi:hypothetical protein